jgi:hypothetical protein
MMVNLRDLLKKIFELKGVEVLDREPYEYLWVKYEDGLELIYIEDKEIVDGNYVINFSRDTEQIHAYKSIICLKGYSPDAKNMAEKLDVELLDRVEFARVLGEFLIELHEKNKLMELELLTPEDVEVEELETEGDEDTIPIFLEEISEEGEERIIKPTISPEEAASIARNYVRGFHQELILLPYFIFEYSIELLIEGTMKTKPVKGLLAINAVNKKYELWKRGYETTTKIDMEHRKMEPLVGIEESKKMVDKIIEEEFSREEEVKIEGENVTIIEKRKTRPKKGSLKVNFIGLYYLPVWVIEGKDGMLMINAATGETIKREMY